MTDQDQRAERNEEERVEDLEVNDGQASGVLGGTGSSGGDDQLTENISLNAKK